MSQLTARITDKMRHGLVLQWALDRLKAVGLHIYLYHLMLESTLSGGASGLPAECCTGFLESDEMEQIGGIDGRRENADELRSRLSAGQRCFAMKCGKEIAAFTWLDLRACNAEPCHFSLAPEAVYLFDLHTVKKYRGRGFAGFLRFSLYQALRQTGKTAIITITECFNTPALRFKKKIGVQIVSTTVFIKLWRRPVFSWTLWRRKKEGFANPVPVLKI